jgi:hypothetical protein
MRAGAARRAAVRLGAILALAAALAACGGDGDGASTAPADAGDAAALNVILARQLAVVDAYDATLAGLRGRRLALARWFRAQEQEHIDAVVGAMRRIGAAADPAPEAVTSRPLGGEADRLAFLAELEGRTIEIETGAIAALTDPKARATLSSIVANQAQHLVLLRRALGASPARSVPSAFENGTEPLP